MINQKHIFCAYFLHKLWHLFVTFAFNSVNFAIPLYSMRKWITTSYSNLQATALRKTASFRKWNLYFIVATPLQKGLPLESRERKKPNVVNLICFQSARALYRNCSSSPFTCVYTSAAKPSSSNQFQLVGWHGQFTGPAAERGPRIMDVTAKHETKGYCIGFVPTTEINSGLLQHKSNVSCKFLVSRRMHL